MTNNKDVLSRIAEHHRHRANSAYMKDLGITDGGKAIMESGVSSDPITLDSDSAAFARAIIAVERNSDVEVTYGFGIQPKD